MTARCFFSQCQLPATNVQGVYKCASHRYRAKCKIDQCPNQAYARSMCVRHGGKAKCKVDRCQSKCRVGEYCIRHGPTASRPRCSELNCEKLAQSSGKCVHHGGGRFCKMEGCFSKGQYNGVCSFHHQIQQCDKIEPLDLGQWCELPPDEEAALYSMLVDSDWLTDSSDSTITGTTFVFDLLDDPILFHA